MTFSHDDLVAVLEESQRLGFLGARPIPEVIEHSRAFVEALHGLRPDAPVSVDETEQTLAVEAVSTTGRLGDPTPIPPLRIADLGAGGGVPGFVIAAALPAVHLTLIDRRTKRTDFLARMVARHRLAREIRVIATDVEQVVSAGPANFDAVVARGFGPPMTTLGFAAELAVRGGRVVISEPPDGDRWSVPDVAAVGLERVDGPAGVAVFEKH